MSVISDLFGGSSSSSNGGYQSGGNTGSYIPLDLQTENQDWINVLNQLQNNNIPEQLYPQIASTAQGIVNNPYAGSAQTSAGNAGTASTNVGNTAINNSNTLSTTGNALIPYATLALNAGFDPQNAIYNQDVSNLTNQVNAENAAAGIGTSPVGASITANTLGNFQNTWNQQKLANQNTAATTANNINTAGGADLTQSANLGNTGVNAINTGGTLPYTQYNTNLGNALSALNTQSTAGANTNTVPENVLNSLMSYLGLGQTAYSNANNAANTNFENSNSLFSSIGSLLGGVNLPSMSSLNSLFSSGASDAGASDLAADASDAIVFA